MNAYPDTNAPPHHSGLNSKSPNDAVYRDQVQLLYQHLPISLLAVLVIAPVFSFIIWDSNKTYPILIWLVLIFVLAGIRSLLRERFKRLPLREINTQQWEYYFLAGVAASALLWGSTSLWIDEQSPVLHQILAVFILTGLIGSSIAGLSFRPVAFRLFLVLILLPYIFKFISFGNTPHYAIAGLMIFYILVMVPISMRISRVIKESLQLRYKNNELLDSYQEADKYNIKANKALYEIMEKNKEKELALEKSETFLRSILSTANDVIITTDKKGIILAANHTIERDFGYTKQEILGKNITIVMADEMGPRHDHYMHEYLEKEKPTLVGRMLDVMGKRKDGSLFPMEITVSETRVGDNMYFTGIIRDISERKEYEKMVFNMMQELADAKLELEEANTQLHYHNKTLTDLSEHDALTDLANRRYLMKTFKREWFRHQRNHKPLSVVLMDIDFFKRFNDSHGHQAGDECLKQIAGILEKNIERPADFIARYGGEEFIAVLPETNLDGAFHIAERMRRAVETLQIQHGESDITDHVTISAGVASILPAHNNSGEQLIKHADEVLYEAKHNGRNCVKKHPG